MCEIESENSSDSSSPSDGTSTGCARRRTSRSGPEERVGKDGSLPQAIGEQTIRSHRPRLAVTLGDPRGIGPEIAARALAKPLDAEITVVGAEDQIAGVPASRTIAVGTWGLGSGDSDQDRNRVLRAGRIAGHSVEAAVKLALSGEVDAIVTAPAHKHALHLAGFPYPGHTEWLAHLAGDVDVAMMLAAEPPVMESRGHPLRVVLVTTHVPFRDVPALLTTEL